MVQTLSGEISHINTLYYNAASVMFEGVYLLFDILHLHSA